MRAAQKTFYAGINKFEYFTRWADAGGGWAQCLRNNSISDTSLKDLLGASACGVCGRTFHLILSRNYCGSREPGLTLIVDDSAVTGICDRVAFGIPVRRSYTGIF